MPKPKSSRKSRAKYECPAELAELIEAANLIPVGMSPMPDLRFELKEAGPDASSYEVLRRIAGHLPADFWMYLENAAISHADPWGKEGTESQAVRREIVGRYLRYCDERGALLWLVQRLETERQMMRTVGSKRGLPAGSVTFEAFGLMDWGSFPLSPTGFIVRGEDGRLALTGLAGAIQKGFDDSRLRRCEICQNVFWASRSDAVTCSPSCKNKRNLKLFRERTPEQKEEDRRVRQLNREARKRLLANKQS